MPSNGFHHYMDLLEDSLLKCPHVSMFHTGKLSSTPMLLVGSQGFQKHQDPTCLALLCCPPACPTAEKVTHWRPEYPGLDEEQLIARFKLNGEFHSVNTYGQDYFSFPHFEQWLHRELQCTGSSGRASPSPATAQKEGHPVT